MGNILPHQEEEEEEEEIKNLNKKKGLGKLRENKFY